MASKPPSDRQLILANRKARHKFHLSDHVEAGIVLIGCEVKSLREHLCNWADAYCLMRKGELWLHGLHIKNYINSSFDRPDPDRRRKLLLHRRELNRIEKKTKMAGLTVVPTQIYINGKHVKVEIAIARGKKTHDKRQDLKKRDAERQMARHRLR